MRCPFAKLPRRERRDKMKNQLRIPYFEAELTVITVEAPDIITASGNTNESSGGYIDGGSSGGWDVN